MSYGASAYLKANVAKEVTPRELEAGLLIKGAAKLEAVKREGDVNGNLADALAFNRKLWTILATSVTSEENPLPRNVKQDFANLSVFMLKTLISLAGDPQERKLTQIIDINATIAAGLRS